MEKELASHLQACAAAYAAASGLELSTLGQRAAGDWRFFTRIAEGTGFTIRKYDGVMEWFAANWPERTPWPRHVPRPKRPAA